jgi:RNA polymerase sigma factor (sigma-70 family)
VDDHLLVQQARRGNDRAFAVLVRAHQRSLYCTAYAILGSSWDASDVVQDAFLEAYAKLETLRDPARFKPWLLRILVHACYDTIGMRGRVVAMEDVPEAREGRGGAAEAHTFLGREAQLDLLQAIKGLEEDHRVVIALRYFHDLKVDDIAAVLDVPAGTVKSRINRALARLSETLGRRAQLEVKP